MAWWDQYFSAGQRGKVPPEKLEFDISNPRFTPDKQPSNSTDAAIIAYLDRTADLGELIQSIASSGYIDIEPLIVIPRDGDLIVLEGNRRLAALKSLLNPALASEAGIPLPEISPTVRKTLERITAYKVEHQDEARNLIGFKHINGPQGWDAYAKALYAARWLDDETAKGDSGLSLNEIAARMGDKHDTLYRIVSAAYVLQQAQDLELFRVEDRVKKNFSFSHLYTALTYTEFRDFVGLPRADRSANPERNPIAQEFYQNLRTLLLWLFGSKSDRIDPVIKTQNPDLSLLKRVLGHAVARKVMLERHDLAAALSLTIEGSDRFSKALVDAQASLHQAVGEITNADNDEETIEIADDVRRRATFIYNTLVAQRPDGN
ncbi:ParB N-terminal domain-containing protein [Sphingobium sp. YR657]|uniref:ParB N-terminal domain-containing protein n=1 Tax=Sphingobium sp. YR657 TaxID=1884366 RepID=UPI0031381CBC